MKTGDPTAAGESMGQPSPEVLGLLELPDSLRKTVMTLQKLGEATSQEVAEKTERTRTVETIYLNQLVRLGYLSRSRQGRKVYFKMARYY